MFEHLNNEIQSFDPEDFFQPHDPNLKTPIISSDRVAYIRSAEDRQKYIRCDVYLASELIVGDQSYKCVLLNISQGGARLQVSKAFVTDTEMILRVSGFDDLLCRLTHQNENVLGLSFTQPTVNISETVYNILEHGIKNELRSTPRRGVMFKANYHTGIRVYKCKVVDISLGGMRVRTDRNFSSKELVTIETPRFGSFPCSLVWHKDTQHGLKFLDHPSKILESFGHILPINKL